MKDILTIEATEKTPKVIVDFKNAHIEISGVSLPEHAAEFYDEIMLKVNDPRMSSAESLTLKCFFIYVNSPSSKALLIMLRQLQKLNEHDAPLLVEWHYESDDEDIKELGENLLDLAGIKSKFIAVDP